MLTKTLLIYETYARFSTRGTLGTIPGVDSQPFRPPARPWGARSPLSLVASLRLCCSTVVCRAQRAIAAESARHIDMWRRLLFELHMRISGLFVSGASAV